MKAMRGADVLARTLAGAGVRNVFSLSGNHVMAVYDAALDAKLKIVHTRHEGAAVHMADAWGRLTGEPGIALLTGGPGHANGVGALYTALAAESPVVMLSGHAPLEELGRGAFQEMRQADLAAPVVKASWTAAGAATLGADVARAMRIACSGRPGPVHLSLPVDVLEAVTDDAGAVPQPQACKPAPLLLTEAAAAALAAMVARARRPLVLTGPQLARAHKARARLAAALGTPVIAMESPRGINDPGLGAFAEVLKEADFVVLLGKQPDFTLRFAGTPAVAADCRFALIDPEPEGLARGMRTLGDPRRIAFAVLCDAAPAAAALTEAAGGGLAAGAWAREVEAALRFRPDAWKALAGRREGVAHPAAVGAAVQALIDSHRDAVLVSDGGEFGQWAQACVDAPERIINGPGGSIGSALPFALAARLARPDTLVVAMSGDGAFGYHVAEFETAAREALTCVAVVGNDACWNAEHQIQLRTYGADRARGCELLPARYDEAARAFGGHGEFVPAGGDLQGALTRAAAANRAACVNVLIERVAAPAVTRPAVRAAAAAR